MATQKVTHDVSTIQSEDHDKAPLLPQKASANSKKKEEEDDDNDHQSIVSSASTVKQNNWSTDIKMASNRHSNSSDQETIANLQAENAQLRQDNSQLRNEISRLRQDNSQLRQDNSQLHQDLAKLHQDFAQLQKAMDRSNRIGQREQGGQQMVQMGRLRVPRDDNESLSTSTISSKNEALPEGMEVEMNANGSLVNTVPRQRQQAAAVGPNNDTANSIVRNEFLESSSLPEGLGVEEGSVSVESNYGCGSRRSISLEMEPLFSDTGPSEGQDD